MICIKLYNWLYNIEQFNVYLLHQINTNKMNYDKWKLETPPTFGEFEKDKCIFCEKEATTKDDFNQKCCEECKKELEEEELLLFITIN